jgi:hypothetical protein
MERLQGWWCIVAAQTDPLLLVVSDPTATETDSPACVGWGLMRHKRAPHDGPGTAGFDRCQWHVPVEPVKTSCEDGTVPIPIPLCLSQLYAGSRQHTAPGHMTVLACLKVTCIRYTPPVVVQPGSVYITGNKGLLALHTVQRLGTPCTLRVGSLLIALLVAQLSPHCQAAGCLQCQEALLPPYHWWELLHRGSQHPAPGQLLSASASLILWRLARQAHQTASTNHPA